MNITEQASSTRKFNFTQFTQFSLFKVQRIIHANGDKMPSQSSGLQKYSLIIALFRNMHTFQSRFTITSLATTRPEHSRTISGLGAMYTVATEQFFQVHTR